MPQLLLHQLQSKIQTYSGSRSKARRALALLASRNDVHVVTTSTTPHPRTQTVLERKPHERNSFPATRLEPRSFACCPARVNQQPSTPCAPARFKHAQPEAPMTKKKAYRRRVAKKQTRSRLISHRQEDGVTLGGLHCKHATAIAKKPKKCWTD